MGTYFALIKFMRFEKIALFAICMLVLVSNVAAQSAGIFPSTQGPIPSQLNQMNETNELNKIREEARRVAQAAVIAQQDAILKALTKAQAEADIKIPFNRNLRPRSEFNLPQAEDGIHDPTNEDIKLLHNSRKEMANFPPSEIGNRVDWVAAIAQKKITPAWDLTDPDADRMVMDLDITRFPRGSMPNVIFPHKQHTEWLACANCHPAVFVPQKGFNQINMRLILGGERCGVCHGKVSFPPTACLKCHSQDKVLPTSAATNTTAAPSGK